jgi:hypothetical protein
MGAGRAAAVAAVATQAAARAVAAGAAEASKEAVEVPAVGEGGSCSQSDPRRGHTLQLDSWRTDAPIGRPHPTDRQNKLPRKAPASSPCSPASRSTKGRDRETPCLSSIALLAPRSRRVCRPLRIESDSDCLRAMGKGQMPLTRGGLV